jgi:hypothetical protein
MLNSVTNDLISQKRSLMEDQITKNVPYFRDVFTFAGVQLSMKTKPVGKSDDRSCYVYQDRRIISVMSGKIDTVFFATERILSILEAQNSQGSIAGENTIRGDIVTAGRVAEWHSK